MNWETLINVLTPIGTALVGFFAGKKRSEKEIEQLSLGNVEQALSIYKEMLDDMKSRYDAEIDALKKKLIEAQKHIETLENKMKTLSSSPRSKVK